jgi:hypothetical protein
VEQIELLAKWLHDKDSSCRRSGLSGKSSQFSSQYHLRVRHRILFNQCCSRHSHEASLRRDTNDTAGGSGTGVASLEGLLVAALAEVVGAGVHNDGAANNALGADELHQGVGDGALGVALAVGLEVAEVTNVADIVSAVAVVLAVGVEVGAGGGAAVGVVTKGVDVEAALGVGVVARDVVGDLGGSTLGLLLEGDGAGDLGVTTDDGNCFDHFGGLFVLDLD